MADGTAAVRTEITVNGEPLAVLSSALHEALFAVPWALCEVASPASTDAPPPDPAAFVGKKAEIAISRAGGGASRSFVGVVVEAERSIDGRGSPSVRLRVAPQLWRAGKRADCRVFQEKSVPDIVQEVLSGAGVEDVELRLSGSYDPRVYCVQYRETDLDFVLRLLSEEGIFFAVEHANGSDKVVLGDDPRGLGELEGKTTLTFAPTFGFEPPADSVAWVRRVHEVRPDKVFVRDYDFERPKFQLEAGAEGKDDGEKSLEVYAYPARCNDEGVAKRYAQVLLDSLQAGRDVVSGETTVMTMRPGLRFSIAEHPYDPMNEEYMIVSVQTETRERRSFGQAAGSGRDYVCRFTAIPTGRSPYRPARRPRAQAIPGLQTAITTGPAGGEIHTDNHGRVKVKHHWDRVGKSDDSSSLWMRTSQVPTGGSMLLPRVGWEVAVCHLEGDADQPMVMSRLYNTLTPPPYALPAGKARGAVQTATTPGGGSSNELRMDDSKGSEEMFFNASKDASIDVVNNTTESIGNNEKVSVGSNQALNVTNSVTSSVGASQTVKVGGNQKVHVETFKVDDVAGAHSLSIGGNRTMMVGGDHKRTVAGSSKVDVGALAVDAVVGSVNETVLGSATHDVGAALVEMTAGSRSIIAGGSRTETTGAAKAVICFGGRGVTVGGSMTQKVAGAILTSVDASRVDGAGGTFTEVAGGAHIVKADNVTFEGQALVSFVMGASTITLTPASISIAGVSIKLDGATAETAALILDN
jgi:type VI secretion system secreted protein VgrG